MRLGACDRLHLVSAGIKSRGDALDIAPLAGRVPPLVGDDDRDLFEVQLVVQIPELFLRSVEFLAVLFVGDGLVGQGDLGQKRCFVQAEGILQDRDCQRVILERGVYPLIQETQNLQLRPLFVGGVDDIPGGCGPVCVFQIPVVGLQVFFVLFVFENIILIHPPGSTLVVQKSLETFLLGLLTDMEKEFHHQIAVVSKGSLGRIDAAHASGISLFIDLAGHLLPGDLLHPESIKENKFSCLRDLFHIAVQEWIAHILR